MIRAQRFAWRDWLPYIFWAAALFLLGGCTRHVLVYTHEACRCETATASPAGLIYDPPPLALYSGEGASQVGPISLNSRPQFEASNGWYDYSAGTYYRLRYYERHADERPNDGYLDRTFTYYREGVKIR